MAKKAPTVPQKAPQKPKVNRNPDKGTTNSNTFMYIHNSGKKK